MAELFCHGKKDIGCYSGHTQQLEDGGNDFDGCPRCIWVAEDVRFSVVNVSGIISMYYAGADVVIIVIIV